MIAETITQAIQTAHGEISPELWARVEALLTRERKARLSEVLEQRSDYVRVVLEDLFQPHNAAAVLRSCDALGVQGVDIIQNRYLFKTNAEVDMGTAKWLDIHSHRATTREVGPAHEANTLEVLRGLKAQGYRLVALSPHAEDVMLEDLDVSAGPMALLFGTEISGLSDLALQEADEYVRIPMYGFVESYNISVSCALALYSIMHRVRTHEPALPWPLAPERLDALSFEWMLKSIPHGKAQLERFRSEGL